VKNFLAHQALAHGEATRFAQFARQMPLSTPLVRVPVFPAFPGDFGGLINLSSYLFGNAQKPKSRRTVNAARSR
jgi:hypothetical protein